MGSDMHSHLNLTSEEVAYNQPYLSLLPAGDILDLMRQQTAAFGALPSAAARVPDDWTYAPGKWTIREVTAHLSSEGPWLPGSPALLTEMPPPRRLPKTTMPPSTANARSLLGVVTELVHLREANLCFFSSLADWQWLRVGTANSSPASVRALAYAIVGHAAHHVTILRDRYKVPLELWPVA
jgi:hypothetical protein